MRRGRDSIRLNDVYFYAYHGVLPEEKKLGQPFLVSLELFVDLQKAGETDDLDNTVNYADVYETVKAVMEGPSRHLLESLAETIAARVLHGPVKGVVVEIKKPAPPIPASLSHVSVKIKRGEV